MIKYFFVFLISIASINAVYTQNNIPTWYDLEIVPATGYSFQIRSYERKDEQKLLKGISPEIQNLVCSSITFTGRKDRNLHLKDDIHGCRGTKNGKEILLLDTNLDGIFDDEEIIFLPELVKDPSIEYSPKYTYGSDFVHHFDAKYDYLLNDQLYRMPYSAVASVLTSFDSVENKLYYQDKFALGSANLLRFNLNETGTAFLYSIDYLPWQNIITFKLIEDGKQKGINLKEKFKIESSGLIYSIDSLDKINKRILISTSDQMSVAQLNGPSITDHSLIQLQHYENDFTLLHFWGTWCIPCVRNLPKLNPLKNTFPQLDILSISVSGIKAKAIELIEQHNMVWSNIFFESEDEMEQHTNFKIYSFPTYMLLDKEKNILGRYNKIEDIESKLNQLVD